MKSVHEVRAESDLRQLADLRAELEAFAAREAAGRPGSGAEARRTLRPILARLREAAKGRDHEAFRDAGSVRAEAGRDEAGRTSDPRSVKLGDAPGGPNVTDARLPGSAPPATVDPGAFSRPG
jgi:hypothetical protein